MREVYIMNNAAKQISQIQSLEEGKGLYYILNEAYNILGNPLVLFDMEYKLLAFTENIVTDDHLWNEIVGTGIFCSESIKLFMEECFIDIVAGTKSTALLTSDKLKYERLYGRVFNRNLDSVANLIMVVCNKPLEDHDSIIFETVCEKLTKEIGTNEYYQQYGILYHEELIRKLLNKDVDDKIIYSAHLSNLYEGLKTNLYVGVADFSKCSTKNSCLDNFRDLYKKTQPESKYAVYSDYIVIIVSSDETVFNIEKDLNKLNGLFERDNIYVGISGNFDNFFDLRKYYNEAVASLKHGLGNTCRRRIFPYDNISKDSTQ